ncbi:MAG: FHA domain-containing protein [Pirellula sp.]|jgi:pSer/pThr/pTyr-binding forkhead associated (FHA) protein|nr:FHA domain-containing protein [Pirellula sp.]
MQYRLSLVSIERSVGGQSWTLNLPVNVGRNSELPVCIDDDSISRSHCQLYLSADETLMVRDLGSMNGTYVNGTRIRQAHSLVPGDELQLGSVTFRIDYTSDTDPGPAMAQRTTTRVSTASTQKIQTVPSERFTMMEVKEPTKRWWEFWK